MTSMTGAGAVFVRGAKPHDLDRIAQLWIEGFPEHFRRIFGSRGDTASRVVREVLRVEHAEGADVIVAQRDRSVIGMLLLKCGPQRKTLREWFAVWREIRRQIGLRSLFRLLRGLALSRHSPSPGEAYVDAIVVAEGERGSGVGQLLMRYAEGWARAKLQRELSLHVSTSNPRARSLYQRIGLAERKRVISPVSGILLGDWGSIYMTKALE